VPRFVPPPHALEIVQDRFTQKQFFHQLGIPTAAFFQVDDRAGLDRGLEAAGFPAVLKTRRWGYDGKGQAVLQHDREVGPAWEAMGGSPLILESFVHFEREVSLVCARSVTGETVFYPLTENRHRQGILRVSLAPACGIPSELQQLAESYARKIFTSLDYAGVLTVEFFYGDGKLLANEMATRVHNSGHWTIEGAETSQFENHLRAIGGLPLGSPAARCFAAMVNLIGTEPDPRALLAVPGAHLHLYGKSPRPGRKLGHVTLCASSREALADPLHRLQVLASNGRN
jgi:5-(carboxyamino)imidazole ribonucleotide synthase